MSDCTTYRPLIGSREGELTATEAAGLAEHVSGCAGCRRWTASLAVTEGLVSESLLAVAARRDFAPFADQVMARIERRRFGPLARLRRTITLHPWFAVGGTLAPIAAALLMTFYIQRTGHDLATSSLEVNSEGATTIIQSNDGPLVLIDDDDEES
jgi:predicted anti-sigma-YlaC factor YlaD